MNHKYIMYDPVDFCKAEITYANDADELTRLRAELAAVTAERDRLREALEEIQNPIEAMQKRAAAENAKLNGSMAKFLAENANYLRGIARAAIEGVTEPPTGDSNA